MKYSIILFFLTFSLTSIAQYTGGDGDGSNVYLLDLDVDIYQGSENDGYSSVAILGSSHIYYGSDLDGHAVEIILNIDGIYHGSSGDGHATDNWNSEQAIYTGSNKDGYNMQSLVKTYIWLGDEGTGWNVTGNWTDGVIPRLRHNVVIPNGRPNYPKLNSGILQEVQN